MNENISPEKMIEILNKQETLEEKRKFLIKIGLIDENGKLTKTYTNSNNISRAITQNKPYNNAGQTMKTIKDFKEFFSKINLDDDTEICLEEGEYFKCSDIKVIKFIKIKNLEKYEKLFYGTEENNSLIISTAEYSEYQIKQMVDESDIIEILFKIVLSHNCQ